MKGNERKISDSCCMPTLPSFHKLHIKFIFHLNDICKINENKISVHSQNRPSLDGISTASGTCHVTGLAVTVLIIILYLNAKMVAQKRLFLFVVFSMPYP
jgi:hypothetical protein